MVAFFGIFGSVFIVIGCLVFVGTNLPGSAGGAASEIVSLLIFILGFLCITAAAVIAKLQAIAEILTKIEKNQ